MWTNAPPLALGLLGGLLLAQLPVAPPKPPAEAGVLRVHLLHGDGPAPADTEVRLYDPTSPLCGTSQRISAPVARSDRQGWAVFRGVEPGAWTVRAESWSLGDRSIERVEFPKTTEVTLAWPRGQTIAAQVLEADGRPATEAVVMLVRKDSEGDRRCIVLEGNDGRGHCAQRHAPVDSAGRARFEALESGRWAVVATGPDEVATQAVATEPGGPVVVLRLPHPREFRGRVVDADGRPVQARVLGTGAEDDRGTGYLDGRWEALFEPVPARPKQRLLMRGVDSGEDGLFVLPMATDGPVDLVASAGCSESAAVRSSPAAGLELRFKPPAQVRGRLVAPPGHVLPERVSVQGDCYPRRCLLEAVPLEGGRFGLPDVFPECTRLFIGAEGFLGAVVELKLERGKTVDVGEQRLDVGATVQGVVRDGTGQPRAGLPVTVVAVDSDLSPWRTESDAEGAFRIERVRPGRWRVRVEARVRDLRRPSALAPVDTGPIDLQDAAVETVALTVPTGF